MKHIKKILIALFIVTQVALAGFSYYLWNRQEVLVNDLNNVFNQTGILGKNEKGEVVIYRLITVDDVQKASMNGL